MQPGGILLVLHLSYKFFASHFLCFYEIALQYTCLYDPATGLHSYNSAKIENFKQVNYQHL